MLVFPSTLEPLLKRLPFSLVLGALVTASVLAMQSAPAATTSDFRLRADMLPASCDLTISNNGIVDFGVIMAASLSDTGFTRVGKRDITLNITCDAAAKVAISASDGRPGTIPAGIGKFLYANQDDASVFGAGNVDGHNIGGYLVYHNADGTADGVPAYVISSEDNGISWVESHGRTNSITPTRIHGWSRTVGGTPDSFTVTSQPYVVELALNRKQDLPALTGQIPIDGLVTFTIQYL
ncbi:MAG: hypothetical protein CL858_22920 [Cupriavidus sp.]|nr:DUF1120 domain-containing protein [Cupriavidus pauculus]MBU68257.1 hypothetical protein [Cupriavidus sp.]MCM3607001.1 DUF1120 domain-containing protein [Cupriavidus pauculus]